MLNLALTGHPLKGWPVGRVSNVVGDKSSGKTLLAIEAASLFLENPPQGVAPRVEYMEAEAAFDEEYAKKLGLDTDRVNFSRGLDTVEQMFDKMDNVIDSIKGTNQQALCIVDSLDALSSKAEMERGMDEGTYGMEKQKKLGEMFRKCIRRWETANMHIMIISQIRENIGAMPFAPKYRRSGGKALDFYASHVLWLAETGKLKTSDKSMVIGIDVKGKITKNKVSVPYRDAAWPVYFMYGIDDITSVVSWLTSTECPKEHKISKSAGYLKWQGENLRLKELVEVAEQDHGIYSALVRQAWEGWTLREDRALVKKPAKAGMVGNISLDGDSESDSEPPPPAPSFGRGT
jgi:protein RecA